jgi:hypothetical protein
MDIYICVYYYSYSFTKFDRRTRYLSLDEDVSVADVVDKLQNMKREVLKVNASTEVNFFTIKSGIKL